MKLLIAGDISTWNIPNFSLRNIASRFREKICAADCVVFNLEGPISSEDHGHRLEVRTSPYKNIIYHSLLRLSGNLQPPVFSDDRIFDLLSLNPNTVVTLANNHIKDKGRRGFEKTLIKLESKGVRFVGGGSNLEQANRPLFLNDSYALFNVNYVASRKWGIPLLVYNATRNDYGAAYYSYRDLTREIEKTKNAGKKILLFAHAGSELSYRNDSINIGLSVFHALGADVTVIHHPHAYCETTWEKLGVFVIGDFIFNRPGHLDPSRKSATIEVNLTTNDIKFSVDRFNVDEVYDYEG